MRISNQKLQSWNMPLIEDESQLSSFIEFVKDEENRLNNEFYIKSQKGEVDSKWTPVEKARMPFRKVNEYVIGKTYHLSWAYKAAKFKLIKVLDDTYGLVDNPKYKRKDGPLKIKLEDLRHIRTANIAPRN